MQHATSATKPIVSTLTPCALHVHAVLVAQTSVPAVTADSKQQTLPNCVRSHA
jgi:hypothetical protein